MSANNKSLVSQALLEMQTLREAIKDESKETIKAMLGESIKDALRESCNEEDEDGYEVVDEKDAEPEKKDDSKKSEGFSKKSDLEEDGEDDDPTAMPEQDPAMGQEAGAEAGENPMDAEQAPEAAAEGEDGGDEWSGLEQYQVGDDTYDLTNEKDYNQVVKVYKLLKDEDEVVVKKENNTVKLQDNGTGNEYVIDLGGEDEAPEAAAMPAQEDDGEEMPLNEGGDPAGFPSSDEDEFIFDDDAEGPNGVEPHDDEEFMAENKHRFEGKKSRKMNENKEVIFEVDLGYTDNYQSKDPIKGLSNSEPSKSGKSWEKGVPTGTEKPWAGETKSKGDPFKKTEKVEGSVNEEEMPIAGADANVVDEPIDEAAMSCSSQADAKRTKSNKSSVRVDHLRNNSKEVSVAGDFKGDLAEEVAKLRAENKKLTNENKVLKKAFKEARTTIDEAYLTNVNLGKIVKLCVENVTTVPERVDILNRFVNEAKTVEQAEALYKSINENLKKATSTIVTESAMSATGSQVLNETKLYESEDIKSMRSLMERMGC